MSNLIDTSNQPNLSAGVELKRFKGCYRLIAFMAKLDRNNKPYWVIKLSDIHSCVTAYMFSVPENIMDLHHGAMIQCEICIKYHKNIKYLHLVYLERASDKLSLEKSGLDSLPCVLCPHKQLLFVFCSLVNSIKCHELRHFIAEVLIPSHICLGFIQAPASLNHHHNSPGGLIAHSIEVAQIVATMPWQDNEHRDLAITAALLHDIGKVKTLSAQIKRTRVGQWVDHDSLTLEICSNALLSLGQYNEKYATLLRHVWTCASPGARYGYRAATPIANAVQNADNLSASMNRPANKLLRYD